MKINNSNLYTNLYHLYIALHDMPFISLCIVLTQLFGASFQRLPRHLPIGNVPGRIECRDPEFSILQKKNLQTRTAKGTLPSGPSLWKWANGQCGAELSRPFFQELLCSMAKPNLRYLGNKNHAGPA